MAKPRVLKSNVHLLLHSSSLLVPIPLGEIDNFTARSTTEIIKSRAIGYVNERATPKHSGWEFSFDGGKVNWGLVHFYWLQEQRLRKGEIPPSFFITETITHYSGARESYVYKNVILYGIDLSRGEEVTESIQGFATNRTMNIIDTTTLPFSIGPISGGDASNLVREAIFRIRTELDDVVGSLDRPF